MNLWNILSAFQKRFTRKENPPWVWNHGGQVRTGEISGSGGQVMGVRRLGPVPTLHNGCIVP